MIPISICADHIQSVESGEKAESPAGTILSNTLHLMDPLGAVCRTAIEKTHTHC